MSVPKGKRNESSVEFEKTYIDLYKDALNVTTYKFGANKDNQDKFTNYISQASKDIFGTLDDLGKHIKIANSIYPKCVAELETRRVHQGVAVGLCFDLLTKYQIAMDTLEVDNDRYVNVIEHITHEINCIKKWRQSDKGRFSEISSL